MQWLRHCDACDVCDAYSKQVVMGLRLMAPGTPQAKSAHHMIAPKADGSATRNAGSFQSRHTCQQLAEMCLQFVCMVMDWCLHWLLFAAAGLPGPLPCVRGILAAHVRCWARNLGC